MRRFILTFVIVFLAFCLSCAGCKITTGAEPVISESKQVAFLDPVFSMAVHIMLDKESGIQEEELAGIEEICIRGNTVYTENGFSIIPTDDLITSLTDLKWFTGLKYLEICDHAISDLSPLKELENLERLILNNNKISDLGPLALLHNLVYFEAMSNNISDWSPVKHVKEVVKEQFTEPKVYLTFETEETEIPEPFVTWDQETTIPFLCYELSGSKNAYLGLWDLEKGTLSFEEKPLFRGASANWDGGNRFVFVNKKDVTKLDQRIRVDRVSIQSSSSSSWWTREFMVAPSSSNSLFAVYCSDEGIPVLEILNHPLEGKVEMELPELPPGTRILRIVGIEAGGERVNVYFETSRADYDPVTGVYLGHTQSVISATYQPGSTLQPIKWRMVNPEVPSYIAGSGAVYYQVRNGLLICREYDFPDILNLTTGTVTQLPGLEELLREIEPEFKGRDECYGYKDLCIVKTGYEREDTWVTHIIVLENGKLVGRIEMVKDCISVFKDGGITCKTSRPWENTWMFVFPESVYEAMEPGGRLIKPS